MHWALRVTASTVQISGSKSINERTDSQNGTGMEVASTIQSSTDQTAIGRCGRNLVVTR